MPAVQYCVTDQIYFCTKHLEELHSKEVDAFASHKLVPVLTNKFRQKITELREKKDQGGAATNVKDTQNKQQEAVKPFEEDMVTQMFGHCERHPSLGYQYFDNDTGRALCIQDIFEEEQKINADENDRAKN